VKGIPASLKRCVTYAARCVILFTILATGCTRVSVAPPLTQPLTSPLTVDQSVATTNSVRAFAANVADDVTRRGPLAWRDHFADTPNFFMAANGQLVFANSDAATRGIKELP
jgi:hypothetical protein